MHELDRFGVLQARIAAEQRVEDLLLSYLRVDRTPDCCAHLARGVSVGGASESGVTVEDLIAAADDWRWSAAALATLSHISKKARASKGTPRDRGLRGQNG